MPHDATGRNGEPAATAADTVKEVPLAQSIVGLFPDRASAEAAIQDLKAAGFNPERIGMVMRDRGESRGTAGGPTGGLIGMGVPRAEAQYHQGRVEQGGVLVTVDALGRDDEARQILLRNGAEGERDRGVGATPGGAETVAYPTDSIGPYAASRADLAAGAQDAYPQPYPPTSTGIAPGTMADAPGSEQDAAGAASPELSVGSQLGGVQPSAVSDLTGDAPLPRTADWGSDRVEGTPARDQSLYADTVTSAGAQEGADYNRGARREPPDRPVTDADIIADAEGQRRRTDPDLDVPGDADRQTPEQSGIA